jgi:DNA-binding protein H-NS
MRFFLVNVEICMTSYKELKQKIAELEKQAEDARKHEIAHAVADIKTKMAEYGITGADLGLSGKTRARIKGAAVPKYRDPASGATWTGKGRKPRWMSEALTEGKTMQDFLA